MAEKKYHMTLDRKGCIGAAACAAVAPKFWKMNEEDGKVDIPGGKSSANNEHQEIDIDEADLQANKDAADVCPVKVIIIKNKQTGEKVAPDDI